MKTIKRKNSTHIEKFAWMYLVDPIPCQKKNAEIKIINEEEDGYHSHKNVYYFKSNFEQ